MGQTNFTLTAKTGLVIEQWSDVNVFNFENAQRLIDSGYAATMRQMPEIKKHIKAQRESKALT